MTPREWVAFLDLRKADIEQRTNEIGIIGATIVNTMSTKNITVDEYLGRDTKSLDPQLYDEVMTSLAVV